MSEQLAESESIARRLDETLLSDYYAEFRQIARRVLRGSDQRLTLQPTDLVHEAALRLLERSGVWIRNETHLLALAARAIRATLIDEIRRRRAAKRDFEVVTQWDERQAVVADLDIERFDGALDALAAFEPEGARIVELRFYVGLTMAEIAETLALSERTTHRRWNAARAWLFQEMQAA